MQGFWEKRLSVTDQLRFYLNPRLSAKRKHKCFFTWVAGMIAGPHPQIVFAIPPIFAIRDQNVVPIRVILGIHIPAIQ